MPTETLAYEIPPTLPRRRGHLVALLMALANALFSAGSIYWAVSPSPPIRPSVLVGAAILFPLLSTAFSISQLALGPCPGRGLSAAALTINALELFLLAGVILAAMHGC